MSTLTFTRRAAGWYRGDGAHHHYLILKDEDTRLWTLSITHEDLSRVSSDIVATLTFAKQKANEFERNHAGICRYCQRPITFETRTAPGFNPRTGWYDDLPSDPLVCFKAANLGHFPQDA
jgi:hypothetical protein